MSSICYDDNDNSCPCNGIIITPGVNVFLLGLRLYYTYQYTCKQWRKKISVNIKCKKS